MRLPHRVTFMETPDLCWPALHALRRRPPVSPESSRNCVWTRAAGTHPRELPGNDRTRLRDSVAVPKRIAIPLSNLDR